MGDGVGVPRRRAVLAGGLAVLAPGRGARAQPVVAAPGPPGALEGITPEARAVIARLRLARDMLCPQCRDDIERSGVNHPSRRSLIGGGKLMAVRDMIVAMPGLPGAVPALRQVRYGIEVLEYYGEDEATVAIDAAIRAIEAEGRVAARGGPPDPRALSGQLRLARRFICTRCVDSQSAWMRGQRARSGGAGGRAGEGGGGAAAAARGAGARADGAGGAGAGGGRRPAGGCGAGAGDGAVAAVAAVGVAIGVAQRGA